MRKKIIYNDDLIDSLLDDFSYNTIDMMMDFRSFLWKKFRDDEDAILIVSLIDNYLSSGIDVGLYDIFTHYLCILKSYENFSYYMQGKKLEKILGIFMNFLLMYDTKYIQEKNKKEDIDDTRL